MEALQLLIHLISDPIMKKMLLIFSLAFTFFGSAQLTINNTQTVQQYIEDVLLGGGVTVSNIQFNGGPANVVQESVGSFADPNLNIGFPTGVILGSGNVQLAAGNNSTGGMTLGGTGEEGVDADLQSLTLNQIHDECVIEFDFIPSGDTISFQYIFASEEYPEYVCGTVNDAFGFFITGPNPDGAAYAAKNLALIPDPANPSTYTNTPVSINTVNPGVAGSGDSTNCEEADPEWESYNIFYMDNTDTLYEYDGRTVKLTAVAHVQCGTSYHIKLAIGDAGDGILDSGVFLEANSFSSNGVSIVANTSEIFEGCAGAYYVVSRPDAISNGVLPLLIQGTATNGVDYTTIPSAVVFEPGALTDTIFIQAFITDGDTVAMENIEVIINTGDACSGPKINIMNVNPIVASITQGDTLCTLAPLLETATFISEATGGFNSNYTYEWFANPPYNFGSAQGQPNITVAPTENTSFQLLVSDDCGNAAFTETRLVLVECLISIPNVFTPNKDGSNEFFEIRNIEDYPRSILQVFNRWGNLVYEVEGYQNDWSGDDLQEGTYFYQLHPNGLKYETGFYSGFFQLIR